MDPYHAVRFFYPRFLFPYLSFMAFMCHRECNLYDVKCCLSWLLHFTAFRERPSRLAGCSPDSGTCSLWVAKSPVLCFLTQAQRPRSPTPCACVRSACRWGQNPPGQAHRTWGGAGALLPPAAQAVSLPGHPSLLFLSALFLSLCRFLFFCFLPAPPQVLGSALHLFRPHNCPSR